jgi:hypothetical protein
MRVFEFQNKSEIAAILRIGIASFLPFLDVIRIQCLGHIGLCAWCQVPPLEVVGAEPARSPEESLGSLAEDVPPKPRKQKALKKKKKKKVMKALTVKGIAALKDALKKKKGKGAKNKGKEKTGGGDEPNKKEEKTGKGNEPSVPARRRLTTKGPGPSETCATKAKKAKKAKKGPGTSETCAPGAPQHYYRDVNVTRADDEKNAGQGCWRYYLSGEVKKVWVRRSWMIRFKGDPNASYAQVTAAIDMKLDEEGWEP